MAVTKLLNRHYDTSERLPMHFLARQLDGADDDEELPDAPPQASSNPWHSKPRGDLEVTIKFMCKFNFVSDQAMVIGMVGMILKTLFDEPDCPVTPAGDPLSMEKCFREHQGGFRDIYDNLRSRNFHSALREFNTLYSNQTSGAGSDKPFRGDIWNKLFVDWTGEYRGEGLNALGEFLAYNETDSLAENSANYSKCISIIQSSGTGKSRLVSELGKTMFSISFTLRERDSTGYPPGDFEVLDFLTSSNLNDSLDVHSRVIALLSAALQYAVKWMGEQKDVAYVEAGGFARRWHDEMQPVDREEYDSRSNPRKVFCKDVVKTAASIMRYFRGDAEWAGAVQARAYDKFDQLQIVQQWLLEPTKKMIETLGLAHRESETLVLATLVFDEAVNLDPINGVSPRFAALRRILVILHDLPLWCLFLSTNSAIQRFASSRREDLSERIKTETLHRFPPFFTLPMDVEMEDRMKHYTSWNQEIIKPLNNFRTSDHITMFGRPLWRAYWQLPYTELREFALQKLLCGQTSSGVSNSSLDINGVFALLASRLCLDPCMNEPGAIALARDAVNSHLRLVTGFDEVRGLICTVTPSEPVVSDAAAAYLMQKAPAKNGRYLWSNVIQDMANSLLSRGLVDKGLAGELYSRLLFILASDFARKNAPNNFIDFAPSRPLKVIDLFNTLFGQNYALIADHFFESKQRTRGGSGTTFGNAFESAYINFTHFTFTKERLPTDPMAIRRVLHLMLRRNQALQLCQSQEYWDLLIPVYVGAPDECFKEENVSAILVQVKNRVSKNHLESNPQVIKKIFAGHQPVIEVLLDLGVATSSVEPSSESYPTAYRITARGHTSQTFGCLSPGDDSLEDACTTLLSKLNRQTLTLRQKQINNKVCGLRVNLAYPDPRESLVEKTGKSSV